MGGETPTRALSTTPYPLSVRRCWGAAGLLSRGGSSQVSQTAGGSGPPSAPAAAWHSLRGSVGPGGAAEGADGALAAVTDRKQIVFPSAATPGREGMSRSPVTHAQCLLCCGARPGQGRALPQGALSLARPAGRVPADLASSCRPHRPLSWLTETQRPFPKLGFAPCITLRFTDLPEGPGVLLSALQTPEKASAVHSRVCPSPSSPSPALWLMIWKCLSSWAAWLPLRFIGLVTIC